MISLAIIPTMMRIKLQPHYVAGASSGQHRKSCEMETAVSAEIQKK